jgi:hypothetical protein
MKDSNEQNPLKEEKKSSDEKISEPVETELPVNIGKSPSKKANDIVKDIQTSAPSESPQQPQKTGFRYKFAFVLASLIVIVTVAYFLVIHEPTQTVVSISWCGYSASSSLENPQPQVSHVTASWTVPYVNPSFSNTLSVAWVGIGGQYDRTLIQIGTAHDSVFGKVTYSAWYELLPDRPVSIGIIKLSPGDIVLASITLVDPIMNTWSIEMQDITTGKSFQKNVIYDSSMLSAEWVIERPYVGNTISSLANFGKVTFTGCSATIDGRAGSISSFPSSQFIMKNSQSTEIATASHLVTDGTSFSVDYKA